MKSYTPKTADTKRDWHIIDASGQTLGRMAVTIATLLMGKQKPIFAPHMDTGDFVVVVNAEKVKVTGNKAQGKIYYRHSGYPGGLRSVNFAKLMAAHPTRAIEHAVKGMLPHNRLGRAMYRKLRVYAGATHPHQAQVRTREES